MKYRPDIFVVMLSAMIVQFLGDPYALRFSSIDAVHIGLKNPVIYNFATRVERICPLLLDESEHITDTVETFCNELVFK